MKAGTFPSILGGAMLMVASGPSVAAGPPPNGGTVFVTAANADEGDTISTQVTLNAASRALAAKGFVFLDDPGHAALIADIVASRKDVGTGQQKVPAGAASVMGTGVSVPFSTGQTMLVPLERTEITVTLRRRGETEVLWRGAAVTVRSTGSRAGSPNEVATALTAAALQSYPRQARDAVGVP